MSLPMWPSLGFPKLLNHLLHLYVPQLCGNFPSHLCHWSCIWLHPLPLPSSVLSSMTVTEQTVCECMDLIAKESSCWSLEYFPVFFCGLSRSICFLDISAVCFWYFSWATACVFSDSLCQFAVEWHSQEEKNRSLDVLLKVLCMGEGGTVHRIKSTSSPWWPLLVLHAETVHMC